MVLKSFALLFKREEQREDRERGRERRRERERENRLTFCVF
jgi:hypothetical protein